MKKTYRKKEVKRDTMEDRVLDVGWYGDNFIITIEDGSKILETKCALLSKKW